MAAQENGSVLKRAQSGTEIPSAVRQPALEKMQTPASIPEDHILPAPSFTNYRIDKRQRRLPQCVAHRGYKAAHPENTMAAFRAAVKVGTHAIETDIHLTKDEVVVLSHDATLKRCFGRDTAIKDLTWEELQNARTIAEPHEPMPRLQDLLEYLTQPGLEDVWVLLDIKMDSDAETTMRVLASTIASVSPVAERAWKDRIILGIWAAKYLPHAIEYLPGFPVMSIAFSLAYARHYFKIPNVSFNMLFSSLLGPGGRSFLREARQKHHRAVYTWTVNEEDRMKWCIRRHLDGVVTDDPKLFLEVCDQFDEQAKEPMLGLPVISYLKALRFWLYVFVATFFFWSKFTPVASRSLIKKKTTQQK